MLDISLKLNSTAYNWKSKILINVCSEIFNNNIVINLPDEEEHNTVQNVLLMKICTCHYKNHDSSNIGGYLSYGYICWDNEHIWLHVDD